MGALLVCWVVYPLVLLAVTVGCGVLVERAGGTRLPGALLPRVGLAAVIVIAGFLTLASATAPLATPAVVLAAAAGLALAIRDGDRLRRVDRWAVGAGFAVFIVFA